MTDATGIAAVDVEATATSLSLLYDSSPEAFSDLGLEGFAGGLVDLDYTFSQLDELAKFDAELGGASIIFSTIWNGSPIPDSGPSVPGASIGDDPMLIATVPVPEPASLTLFALGLSAVGFASWRRRRSAYLSVGGVSFPFFREC